MSGHNTYDREYSEELKKRAEGRPSTFSVTYLHNRGDGVDGHYCIGRNTVKGYSEFWDDKQQKWGSAGSVFELGKL